VCRPLNASKLVFIRNTFQANKKKNWNKNTNKLTIQVELGKIWEQLHNTLPLLFSIHLHCAHIFKEREMNMNEFNSRGRVFCI